MRIVMIARTNYNPMSLRFDSLDSLASSMGKSVKEVEKRVRGGTGSATTCFQGQSRLKSLEKEVPEYSSLPSKEPQVLLYQALVKRFGTYWNGGDVAYEITNVLPSRKYEGDIVFPNYRVIVEMDGYRHHGLSKSGFKRDRQKWLMFLEHGWVIITISNELVRNKLENGVASISNCLSHREYKFLRLVLKKRVVGCQPDIKVE